jgi:cardiolipin synthase
VNLPNLITLGRLLAVPLAVYLILDSKMAAAFLLFVLAGLSDAVDGFIAKNYGLRTELGALLDPLADKALLVSVYVTLGVALHLPTWLVILVVFRDALIIGGFLLIRLLDQPVRWKPALISKLNTGLQIALVASVLARLGFDLGGEGLITVLSYAVAVTTILSGSIYLVRFGQALAGTEEAS